MTKINPLIFKAYDVRGIYPQEINPTAAKLLAQAMVQWLAAKTIALGWDSRLSSPVLAQAATQGAKLAGAKVIKLGLCTADQLYFTVGKLKLAGGILITASHNPPKYNGIKFCRRQARPLSYQQGLKQLQKLIETSKLTKKSGGRVLTKDYSEIFIKHLLSFINLKKIKPWLVVADASHGTAGPILKKLVTKLPLKLKLLNAQPNGHFPAHGPDPTQDQNIRPLQQIVKKTKANLGVIFDGDADRIFFVDENGQKLTGSEVMLLITAALLPDKPQQTILYNASTSRAVPELIKKLGGQSLRTPTGHSLIKPLMRKSKAVFGGEGSGHFYWQKNYYADSGLITFLVVLQLLSGKNKSLSQLVSQLNPYYQSGEINLTVKNPQTKIKTIAKRFRNGKVDWLDGLTVQYSDWWFNLRASNTEPMVRLNIEAKNKQLLQTKQKLLTKLI